MYYSRDDLWIFGTVYGSMSAYSRNKDPRNYNWRIMTYRKKNPDDKAAWHPYENFYTYTTAIRMRNYLLKQGICAIIRKLQSS